MDNEEGLGYLLRGHLFEFRSSKKVLFLPEATKGIILAVAKTEAAPLLPDAEYDSA